MTTTHISNESRCAVRVANLRKLLARLHETNLTISQAAEMLGISESGTRNYLMDLRKAGLVSEVGKALATDIFYQVSVYGLTGCRRQITAFTAKLDAGKITKRSVLATKSTLLRKRQLANLDLGPSAAEKFVAFRDPLVAALYGPARAAVEVRP
jgi:DNA-binding Lrp family transcriptional regulator